jgi:hypothetical protein
MRRSTRVRTPRPRETVAATGVLLAIVVAVLFAVTYPTAVAAVVTGAAGGSVVTAVALDSRRRGDRTRTVRLPGTGFSVEA